VSHSRVLLVAEIYYTEARLYISYGELGSVIIHQTLYGLFPPSSFDPTLIAPLTPPEFIQRILVPEAAVGLILEDRRLNPQNEKHKEKAVKILRESAAYGVAMFPDADTNVGASSKGRMDEEDWVMGVGDEIVRERARMRRKELEEEERVEEMRIKNETERLKREGGGKKTQKRKENKSKEKQRSNEQEIVEISESSDAGIPKPKPRKVQRATNPINTNEAGHASDTGQAKNGRRTTARKKSGGSSKSRQKSADIDLCSSSSDDTTRRALRREAKGKRKATESEASGDSVNLVYPSSDDMSIDGSDTLVYPSPSPPPAQPLTANNSIVSLLSEDEETPRAKVPPKSNRAKAPISSGASSITKSSFPLQIARNRQFEV
jgi:RTC4-like domain